MSSGQYVTGIWTDYDGFWTSSNGAISAVEPDSSHHLLAFEWGGSVFSTGVNDSILDSHSVTYQEGLFKGIDYGANLIPGTQFVTGSNSDGDTTLVPTGASISITVDGVVSDLVYSADVDTQRVEARRLLRDGIGGLDLWTGMTNIPAQTLDLALPTNGVEAGHNDGIPDFIFTQVAGINQKDSVILLDTAGAVVGNWVQLNFNSTVVNRVATWRVDARRMSDGMGVGTNNHIQRNVQVIALDFNDFGITAEQVPGVASIRHQFTGVSDMTFLSYNELSFFDCSLAPVSLAGISPVAASSPRASDGEVIPVISGGTAPYSLRPAGTVALIPDTQWDAFPAGVYTFEVVDDLGCASAPVRVMIPNRSCNTPG